MHNESPEGNNVWQFCPLTLFSLPVVKRAYSVRKLTPSLAIRHPAFIIEIFSLDAVPLWILSLAFAL